LQGYDVHAEGRVLASWLARGALALKGLKMSREIDFVDVCRVLLKTMLRHFVVLSLSPVRRALTSNPLWGLCLRLAHTTHASAASALLRPFAFSCLAVVSATVQDRFSEAHFKRLEMCAR
jgi:hypothetical protein